MASDRREAAQQHCTQPSPRLYQLGHFLHTAMAGTQHLYPAIVKEFIFKITFLIIGVAVDKEIDLVTQTYKYLELRAGMELPV